ncbi:MAG: hypothetical protein LBJ63_08815 [Prevotellaceae bacterium]|jgi:hypothetical protein|nr:hypothetical protein [Prevotellaceae bacterium]
MENKHAKFIPAGVLSQVQDLVNQANALLLPYVTPLTSAERHTLPKMGEKTIGFVEKAHEFAVQNPNLCPPYLDMAEFDTDYADARNLFVLNNTTKQLNEAVDDTSMLAGSEAYQAALVFYNSVKVAARQDVTGAKAVYEELKKRFPGAKRKAGEAETETGESMV